MFDQDSLTVRTDNFYRSLSCADRCSLCEKLRLMNLHDFFSPGILKCQYSLWLAGKDSGIHLGFWLTNICCGCNSVIL